MNTSREETFDPLSLTMLRAPYPTYSALRAEDPVHWHEGMKSWVLTRYDHCKAVMEDAETFRSDFRFAGEKRSDDQLSLQVIDPPEHTVVRRFVVDLLRGVDVSTWAQRAANDVVERVSRRKGATIDFVSEVVEPVTIESMFDLFGVPFASDFEKFRLAARDLVLSMDSGLAPERREPGQEARRYLSSILSPYLEERPDSGLLRKVDLNVDGVSQQTLINSLRAVFVAGYSSSSSMLGNIVREWLVRDLATIYGGAEVTSGSVAELQRLDAPVQAESRAAVVDVELGGKTIRRGDIMVLMVGAANRDGDHFPHPDEFEPSRKQGSSIAFGRGIHACLGARFAVRLGAEVMNGLQQFDLRIAEDPVQRPTATLRGLDRLILEIDG